MNLERACAVAIAHVSTSHPEDLADPLVVDEAYDLATVWVLVVFPQGVVDGRYVLPDMLPVIVDKTTGEAQSCSWQDAAAGADLPGQRIAPKRPGSLLR